MTPLPCIHLVSLLLQSHMSFEDRWALSHQINLSDAGMAVRSVRSQVGGGDAISIDTERTKTDLWRSPLDDVPVVTKKVAGTINGEQIRLSNLMKPYTSLNRDHSTTEKHKFHA